jgi:plastocyanin
VLATATTTPAAPPMALNPALTATATPQIEIKNFKYESPTLAVPVGATVTWVNRDDELHTVTSPDRLFSSPGLDAGEAFSHRFAAPGTYTYFCALHPYMTGTIIVK